MEDELYLIGHILQERPDLGYVSEDEEDPAPWPEPIFEPRKKTNRNRSHHVKETVQEAEDRITHQLADQPSFIKRWEEDTFKQYQNKCSAKNWEARRSWLNSRVEEQVEADFQKKIGIWRRKIESEFDPEAARVKLQEKVQELLKEKYWWSKQLEHQPELPESVRPVGGGWQVSEGPSAWNSAASSAGIRSVW